MNREIEEMAKTLCGQKEHSCAECDSCDLCEFWLEASILYANGYRKSTDVAREILDEAMALASRSADEAKVLADSETDALQKSELRGEQIGALLVIHALAELKKKHESEGEDDEGR